MSEQHAPSIGANIGALIESRLTEAHAELPPPPAPTVSAETVTLPVVEPVVAPSTPPPVLTQHRSERIRPAKEPAARPQRHITINPHLRLVGIDLRAEPNRVVFSACSERRGTCIIGPELGFAGLLSMDAFLRSLRLIPLLMDPFTLDFGRGTPGGTALVTGRGALIRDPGKYACPSCAVKFPIGFKAYDELRRRQRRAYPCCERADCPGRGKGTKNHPENALRLIPDKLMPLGADDPRVQRLYATYCAAVGKPIVESRYLLPRLWAVYNEPHTPDTVWYPPEDDARALTIAERMSVNNRAIRPWSLARKSGMPVSGLVMEGTSCDGQPGMAVGWLSTDMIAGAAKERDDYGFTVRLVGKHHSFGSAVSGHRDYTV